MAGLRAAVFKMLAERWLTVWIGQWARAMWDRTRSAPSGSKDFLIAAAMYSGMLDAADGLGAGARSLARRLCPPPPAAPTSRQDIHLYLGGYLVGHARVTLAHRRASRHQPFWDPRWDNAVTVYGMSLATSEAQGVLAFPSLQAVAKAHQFACLWAAAHGKPVSGLDLEVALFVWLTRRSGVALPSDIQEHVARLRVRRERIRPDSAAS